MDAAGPRSRPATPARKLARKIRQGSQSERVA